MQGVIYRDGSYFGDTSSDVLYFDNPDDYYAIPEAERNTLNKLVILNTEGDDTLTASNVYYDDAQSLREYLDDWVNGTVLFSGSKAIANNNQYVTLSESVANFARIGIAFKVNTESASKTVYYDNNYKTFTLADGVSGRASGSTYRWTNVVMLCDTRIVNTWSYEAYWNGSGFSWPDVTITVEKVVGYGRKRG